MTGTAKGQVVVLPDDWRERLREQAVRPDGFDTVCGLLLSWRLAAASEDTIEQAAEAGARALADAARYDYDTLPIDNTNHLRRTARTVLNAARGLLAASEVLPEWKCPSCGTTTRARLADKVPEDLAAELSKLRIENERLGALVLKVASASPEEARAAMKDATERWIKEHPPLAQLTTEAAVALLVEHQRLNSRSCLCGWDKLGASHPAHQVEQLAAAGLLVDEGLRDDKRRLLAAKVTAEGYLRRIFGHYPPEPTEQQVRGVTMHPISAIQGVASPPGEPDESAPKGSQP